MRMKDKAATRIRPEAITSFAADKSVDYVTSTSWPTIKFTIGSAELVLNYNKVEDRDSDIAQLDVLLLEGSSK